MQVHWSTLVIEIEYITDTKSQFRPQGLGVMEASECRHPSKIILNRSAASNPSARKSDETKGTISVPTITKTLILKIQESTYCNNSK